IMATEDASASSNATACTVLTWQERNEQGERYLNWASNHAHVKLHTTTVPDCILPKGYQCILHDVQVKVKHGPDDAVYDRHADLRKMVARGNTVLEVRLQGKMHRDEGAGDSKASCLQSAPPGTYVALKALKKFTGGSGDDDDRSDCVADQVWHQYFSKPIASATRLVRTRKANGEALHVAVIRLGGVDYFLGGSKNTHILFRQFEDLQHFTHDRCRVARKFCADFLCYFDQLPADNRKAFVDYLREQFVTAVFEILYSDHQHIELLTNKVPIPKFITFTSHDIDSVSMSYMPPDSAIDLARDSFGLDPTSYEVCEPSEFESVCELIRRGHGYEGEVLYFIDASNEVIGLLKKKTAWYILIRALREKIKSAASLGAKRPGQFDANMHQKNIHKRIREIQNWLGLSSEITQRWQQIGADLLNFCVRRLSTQRDQFKDLVFNQFPVVWKQFLDETGTDDSVF
ncbi:hypothetical protein BOX15_Mlig013642g4, partial [Macrostomum lignano]